MRFDLIVAGMLVALASAAQTRAITWPYVNPVDGHEKLEWEQQASDIRGVTFTIYVDGERALPAEVVCSASSNSLPASGFLCSSQLPAMSPGLHRLELTATEDGAESKKSADLLVLAIGAIS